MAEHSKADYDYQTTVATVLSVARRAKTIFEKSSDIAGKRAFLNYLLQNPTVNGKKLYFSIASPFNLVLQLASLNFAPNNGRVQNSKLGTDWKRPRGYEAQYCIDISPSRNKLLAGHRRTTSLTLDYYQDQIL